MDDDGLLALAAVFGGALFVFLAAAIFNAVQTLLLRPLVIWASRQLGIGGFVVPAVRDGGPVLDLLPLAVGLITGVVIAFAIYRRGTGFPDNRVNQGMGRVREVTGPDRPAEDKDTSGDPATPRDAEDDRYRNLAWDDTPARDDGDQERAE